MLLGWTLPVLGVGFFNMTYMILTTGPVPVA